MAKKAEDMDKEFECPICGSKKYSEELVGGVLGLDGSNWVRNYVCSGCSVLFKDADKFTKKNSN